MDQTERLIREINQGRTEVKDDDGNIIWKEPTLKVLEVLGASNYQSAKTIDNKVYSHNT